MNVGNMSVASTGFDKLVHALMFLVVSGVVFFDNTRYFRQTATLRRIFSGSFLFPIFFGGIIEIGQRHATSYRSGDWIDFLFDVMGAVAGFLICLLINRCLKFPNRG
jgi:VanZ family protein